MLLALFVGALAAAGCAEQLWPEDSAVTPATTASCRSMIRPPELDSAAVPNELITIAETDQEASVVDVAVDGTGSGFVGRLSVSQGVGSVELGCETVRVAVHGTFRGEDGPNFIALAAAGDRLYTLQWQCASGTLGRVWFDGTDGTGASSETLRGSCQENSVVRSRVRFSPLGITLPRLTEGYTIEGPEITLGTNGKGSIHLGSSTYELFAFSNPGCGEGCDILQILLWERTTESVTIARFVLEQPGDALTARYPITLPGFTNAIGSPRFPATFTKP